MSYARAVGFSDPALDKLLDEARAAPDQAKRAALYAQVEQRLTELAPGCSSTGLQAEASRSTIAGYTRLPGSLGNKSLVGLKYLYRSSGSAARRHCSLGASDARIIALAILPNILAPIMVHASLAAGHAILLESGLSFLGLGPPPPTPSRGRMVEQSGRFMQLSALRSCGLPSPSR